MSNNLKKVIPQSQKYPQDNSLYILFITESRLDEVLITNIIKQTTHRIHIVDSMLAAQQSLSLQIFELIMISEKVSSTLCCFQNLPLINKNFSCPPIVNIICQPNKECNKNRFKNVHFPFYCTLYPPITSSKLIKFLQFISSQNE